MTDEVPRRAGSKLGTTDPPRHDQLRALSQAAFLKRNLDRLVEPTLEIADRSLDRIAEQKELAFGSGNRDGRKFPDPDTFELTAARKDTSASAPASIFASARRWQSPCGASSSVCPTITPPWTRWVEFLLEFSGGRPRCRSRAASCC